MYAQGNSFGTTDLEQSRWTQGNMLHVFDVNERASIQRLGNSL